MKSEKRLDCILLIDDDSPTNFLNTKIIESADIQTPIKSYENAENALKYLREEGTHDGEPQPGLIFLDINMPGMNGWEFLEQFDQLPETKRANIILSILTTSINPDDKRLAEKQQSVHAFLSKPLKREHIQRLVDENFSN